MTFDERSKCPECGEYADILDEWNTLHDRYERWECLARHTWEYTGHLIGVDHWMWERRERQMTK